MDTAWIRDALELAGKTPADMSRALEIPTSRVAETLNGRRKVQPKEIRPLADLLNMSAEVVMEKLEGNSTVQKNKRSAVDLGMQVERSGHTLPSLGELPKTLPVMGVSSGGVGDADFQMNGQTIDYVRRPPGLAHAQRAFAVYVVGMSMYPRYEEGELAFVNPNRPAKLGDYVLIELFPPGDEDRGEAGPCFIKRWVRKTSECYVVEQFNPAQELKIPVSHVKHVYKVMSPTELLGIG